VCLHAYEVRERGVNEYACSWYYTHYTCAYGSNQHRSVGWIGWWEGVSPSAKIKKLWLWSHALERSEVYGTSTRSSKLSCMSRYPHGWAQIIRSRPGEGQMQMMTSSRKEPRWDAKSFIDAYRRSAGMTVCNHLKVKESGLGTGGRCVRVCGGGGGLGARGEGQGGGLAMKHVPWRMNHDCGRHPR